MNTTLIWRKICATHTLGVRRVLVNLMVIMLCLTQFSGELNANTTDSLFILLKQENNTNLRADYLLQIGKSYYEQSHENYLKYCLQALEETQKSTFTNDTLKMKIVNNVGCAYSEVNDAERAIEYFLEAAELAKNLDDQRYLGNLYNNIGLTYGNVQQYGKAIDFHQKSLNSKELRSDSLGISISFTNIGAMYFALKKYEQAERFFQESFDISQRIGDTEGMVFGYTNLADIYFEEGNFELALKNYQQYVQLAEELNFQHSVLHGHKKIGQIFSQSDDLVQAEKHANIAYKMAKELDYTWELTNICLLFSEIKEKQKDYVAALKFGKEALKNAKLSQSNKKMAAINQQLSSVYEKFGDVHQALAYHKKYQIEYDSFIQKENIQSFAKMEAEFQLEIKEKENQHLKAEQALHKEVIQQQTLVSILSVLGVVLFGIATFFLLQKNKLKNKQNLLLERKVEERTRHLKNLNVAIQQTNSELERFTHAASHDLKEPLRVISSFAGLSKKRFQEKRFAEVEDYLDYIVQGAAQMSRLVADIISFSDLSKQTNLEFFTFEAAVNQTHHELKNYLKEKNAILTTQTNISATESNTILFPKQLDTVLIHLVENGVKYNQSEQPKVNIQLEESTDFYTIRVSDNGIGIPAEHHDQIFSMFTRLHARGKYNGSGVGLAICKKIIQRLGGQFRIEESSLKGSTFLFSVAKKSCQVREGQKAELVG